MKLHRPVCVDFRKYFVFGNMARDEKGFAMTTPVPFPLVNYLAHEFTLVNHPLSVELLCVAHRDEPVTNQHEQAWLMARRLGVTASGFSELITQAGAPSKGRAKAIASKVTGISKDVSYVNAIKLGNKFEPVIAERVERMYGVEPNHWLIAKEDAPRFLATPDGLSSDLVGEYKTSIKSWGLNLQSYYRQIQWQLFVTGREESVFAVMHPRTQKLMVGLVPRDDEEIELLKNVALEVLNEMEAFSQSDAYAKLMKSEQALAQYDQA